MEQFELLSENIPSIDFILKLSFYVLVGFFALYTAILYYHWSNYATEKTVSRLTIGSFLILTIPLLLVMGGIILII